MKARNVVLVLTAALIFYMGLIGVRGVELLDDPSWAARGLGLGVVLLPVIGAVLVVRELRFGFATEKLGRALGPEDPAGEAAVAQAVARLAVADGGKIAGDGEPPRTASGRLDRDYADAVFAVRKAQAEAAPSDWRVWYRLAMAYSDARDTSRGRRTMRHAIDLEGQQRVTARSDQDSPSS
ncbi:MAG: hypothetical protein ACQSGP_06500 [Frankia sp.]